MIMDWASGFGIAARRSNVSQINVIAARRISRLDGLSIPKMDRNFANGQAVASELSRAVEEKGISIVCDAFDKSRGNALQAYCSQ